MQLGNGEGSGGISARQGKKKNYHGGSRGGSKTHKKEGVPDQDNRLKKEGYRTVSPRFTGQREKHQKQRQKGAGRGGRTVLQLLVMGQGGRAKKKAWEPEKGMAKENYATAFQRRGLWNLRLGS